VTAAHKSIAGGRFLSVHEPPDHLPLSRKNAAATKPYCLPSCFMIEPVMRDEHDAALDKSHRNGILPMSCAAALTLSGNTQGEISSLTGRLERKHRRFCLKRSRFVKTSHILSLLMALMVAGGVVAQTVPSADDIRLTFDPRKAHQEMWDDLKPRLAQRAAWEADWAAKTATNWREYDMTYYRIELAVDHVNKVIYGQVGTYGRVSVASLDTVMVNLLNSMTVDSIYNASGALTFTHQSDHVTVHLDRAYAGGEPFSFTIVYHGTPASSGGFLGLQFSTRLDKPLITTLSEPMGARSWWPCNDIPRDKVDSVDIIVTVDTSLVVSSNGLVTSDVDNGDGTHTMHWHSRYPIAPYLVSLGIHPYTVWYDWYHYSPMDSMPLHFYVYPDHDSLSRAGFGVLPHMLEVLETPFGLYPFIEEKYGCTHFNWGGAMEHQTNTSTTASSSGYSQWMIVHELGHQWWGDLVTCADWHHIWINEGFATYTEALYFEADSGSNYYHAYMNSCEYSGGGSVYIIDTTNVWNIFSAIPYDKGGWILHMLRHVVGDSLFFESLAEYRRQYQWSSATTEDFQGVVEAVTGLDLNYFFQEWVYGTYRPDYHYSYLSEPDPAGGWNSYLHIRQIQTTTPLVFTMPIDVRITTDAGDDTRAVFNDRRVQTFTLHTDNPPSALMLDPDRWISRRVTMDDFNFRIITDTLVPGLQAALYADTVVAKGLTDEYYCELAAGALPPGWSLAPMTGLISGVSYDTGSYVFTVRATNQQYSYLKDSVTYTVRVAPTAPRPGDANVDGNVDLSDIVYIINYIFHYGPAPDMPDWADANADCLVNIGDPVYLVHYLFKEGAVPVLGCAD
jgi:aminopeptidase N